MAGLRLTCLELGANLLQKILDANIAGSLLHEMPA